MTTLKISLRAGEKIFINGAVLRADRKVSLEFLNNVTFLLEQHVLRPEDTITPLRQLYFMIQTAIMEPKSSQEAIVMAGCSIRAAKTVFANPTVLADLEAVEGLLERERYYECLRLLRNLFEIEEHLMRGISMRDAHAIDESGLAELELQRQVVPCR
ncbi:MAG: flagellar biosynthesis repressor FlbT [Hyphomicrobiaceae bacterium]